MCISYIHLYKSYKILSEGLLISDRSHEHRCVIVAQFTGHFTDVFKASTWELHSSTSGVATLNPSQFGGLFERDLRDDGVGWGEGGVSYVKVDLLK